MNSERRNSGGFSQRETATAAHVHMYLSASAHDTRRPSFQFVFHRSRRGSHSAICAIDTLYELHSLLFWTENSGLIHLIIKNEAQTTWRDNFCRNIADLYIVDIRCSIELEVVYKCRQACLSLRDVWHHFRRSCFRRSLIYPCPRFPEKAF